VCPGGGPAQKRPGVSDLLQITGDSAAGAIAAAGGIGYAIIAAVLAQFTYDALNNCQSDPPTPVALSSNEWLAVMLNQPILPDYEPGMQKLSVIVEFCLWWLNCQCVTGPQPLQPAVPAPPSGAAVPPGSNACSTLQWAGTPTLTRRSGSQVVGFLDITPYVIPNAGTPVATTDVNGNPINVYPIGPQKPTQLRVQASTSVLGADTAVQVWMGTIPGIGTQTSCALGATNSTGNSTCDTGIQALNLSVATHWLFLIGTNSGDIHGNGQAGPATATVSLYGNCGQPVGCCPPDPQLLQLLNNIYSLVTLIQRHETPFAYVLGPVHSGLSGSTTLTIPAGLLGLRVHVDTFPPYFTQQPGTPTWYSGLGFLSVGDANGWWWTDALKVNPWLWFPESMPAFTQVGWNLPPGQVISITELQAES
jgi:hypothetical protein